MAGVTKDVAEEQKLDRKRIAKVNLKMRKGASDQLSRAQPGRI